jgi:tetratricopeptide (TPR) repeat protein
MEQSLNMLFLIALVVAVQAIAGSPAAAAQPAQNAGDHRAEAYFAFLQGRHLEGEGDVDAAVEAFRKAIALDPSAAEIQAELAGLYARQNRAHEAVTAAEQALTADADNSEAHWVLGTVYAALSQGDSDNAAPNRDYLDKAITHLEQARPSRRYDLGLALALGRLYLRKSDFAKAIEPLKFVTDQESGATEVWLLLAQAYDGADQRAQGIEILQSVVGSEPRYARAWISLGDMLDKEHRFVEAAYAYEQALRQNPNSAELRLRRATSLLNGGDAATASKLLRQIVSDSPTNGGALYLLIEALRDMREYDEAESVARRLVALEPGQIRGSYALALVYEARREHQKVIDVLEPVASRSDSNPQRLTPLLVRLGLAYQELGDFERAIASFQRAQSLAQAEGLFDAYLAQAYLAAGKTAQAAETIANARKSRPDDFQLARLEADVLAKGGQVDRAIGLMQEQATQNAKRVEVQLGLAAICVEYRRFDCAQAALDRADRDFPDNVLLAFQRGALYERQERYQEAEKAFRDALARDPKHGPTLNYLGYMLAERGQKLEEAVSLLQRALETDPWNGSYLDSLGWAYFARGDLAEAQKYLALAAERLPLNSVVQDHLGDVLFKQGNRESAIAAWQQALKGDRESIEPAAIARKIDDARRAKP